jgi:hypothetical protein
VSATTPDHGQVVPNSGRGGVDAAELFGQREGALGLNVFGEEAAGQLLRAGPRTSLTGGRQNASFRPNGTGRPVQTPVRTAVGCHLLARRRSQGSPTDPIETWISCLRPPRLLRQPPLPAISPLVGVQNSCPKSRHTTSSITEFRDGCSVVSCSTTPDLHTDQQPHAQVDAVHPSWTALACIAGHSGGRSYVGSKPGLASKSR